MNPFHLKNKQKVEEEKSITRRNQQLREVNWLKHDNQNNRGVQ